MDQGLVDNWNRVVGKDDDVYHLGDFCYLNQFSERNFHDYFNALNGRIHFIEGNHDKAAKRNKGAFASYGKLEQIEAKGQEIILCHYSMRVWNKSHHGAWHLYGHSHGSLPDDINSRSFDVGVDCHNYRPISFDGVAQIMSKKTFKPIDHHGT